MAVYAIGDIQGCYDPFARLLEKLAFDPASDSLWLTGDVVNRGPKSLQALRFVRSLGDSAITVLGNHDLHLLALAAGVRVEGERFASLDEVLKAPDRDELVDWLRHRPLAHYDKSLNTLLVHAGTHPDWSVQQTLGLAAEVEHALRKKNKWRSMLRKMYANNPRKWSNELTGKKRLRFIVNCLTRMRMLTRKRRMNFAHTGPPFRARRDLLPWFRFTPRAAAETRIVFGHWSALGLIVLPELVSLDTGCVWGNQLTAVRLDTERPEVIQVPGQSS
ncbi:MAG: symmetrical bis(5'-nucleosyl)-tetraphosphatase [Gammaproteobacteria bacterium]|nr:symmetrical bis(5'-nucleosyl)-tetraphosphatase [Gammaproteobacteria bacterium]MDH5302801.1 symmetrical bis(5'-nucleosyl)-tetraphosphatase [Gammaproteobacteria bacterium]MDH5322361.1 symmetrical bis(5'-nucleosyl)-tetraphosphatase [Gammaproteobacteria bacterium]